MTSKASSSAEVAQRIAERIVAWIDRATPHTQDSALTRDPLVVGEIVAIIKSELAATLIETPKPVTVDWTRDVRAAALDLVNDDD